MRRTRGILGRLLIATLLIGRAWPSADAGMLRPSNYASLGADLTGSGVYQVDTTSGIMTMPGGGTIAGVVSGGVAVFTFASVDISDASFCFVGVNAFALLSQGHLTLDGVSMNASASGQTPGPGGNLNNAGRGWDGETVGAGGGGFGGAGGQGGPFIYTGVAGFGPPWGGYLAGGAGGATSGGLAAPIEGGSAGGNFSYFGDPMGVGGAGGGAVELGAGTRLSLTGVVISADGGNSSGWAAGGGSGGGISLLGSSIDVDVTSSFSATGGIGGPSVSYGGIAGASIGGGGGGGGGRIDILSYQTNFSGSYDLSGANSGVIEFASLPEPTSLVPAGIAVVISAILGVLRSGRHIAPHRA